MKKFILSLFFLLTYALSHAQKLDYFGPINADIITRMTAKEMTL